jgi:DNA-binding transcriptional ArsR family regulator
MPGRLRIHFGAEDVARLRVASGPDVLWETANSMHMLQTRRGAELFDGWRQESRRRLGAPVRMLITLNPAIGSFPDFLTPTTGLSDFEAALDLMLSTPRKRLRIELGELTVPARMRPWVRAVADTEPEAMRELGRLYRSYHRTAVLPAWNTVVAEVSAERQRLAQAYLRGGSEAVLTQLAGPGGWRPPVLELPYPWDRDLFLDGRGLVVVPSYFCWKHPCTLLDPELPPVLTYPLRLRRPVPFGAGRTHGDEPLGAMIGPTRAAVLRALEVPYSTSDLARRAGTSIPSASQHATVLRRAGLITTERQQGTAVHSLTPLGAAMLASQTP